MERWRTIRLIINSPCKNGGSLGNILLNLPDATFVDASTLTLALASELRSDVANQFGAKLHQAFRDDASTLSNSSSPPRVDARFIVTTYRGLLLAPIAFHDPKRVYLKLLQDYVIRYGTGSIGGDTWLLADVVKVVSIAATSDEDVESTSRLLTEAIQRLTSETIITLDVLKEALDSCPSVLQNFRSQMISRLTSDQRLKLLAGEEDKALCAFLRQSNNIIGAKRRNFFLQRYLGKVFAAWRFDLTLAMRAKLRILRFSFTAWLVTVKRKRLELLFTNISHASFCNKTGRRSLQKLVKHCNIMKKIKRCYTSDAEKKMCAGMGYLRIWLKKRRMRMALSTWLSFCITGQDQDLAKKWNETKVIRRAFCHFHSYAMGEIGTRKAARKAAIQQRNLQKHMKENASTMASNDNGVEVKESLLAKQKQVLQFDEARMRQRKVQEELDKDILSQQSQQRRERVENERQRREQQFQSDWAAKLETAESACLERNEAWIRTSDFKNQSQKRLKEVKRYLSIKSISDKDREAAITCQAVISYSILDAKLAHAGIVPDDVFRKLVNTKSPINAVPFQSALVSSGLILGPAEFDTIFRGIANYKDDVTPTKDPSIALEDLRRLRHLSDKHVGQEGTRWKSYVHPIHQQQLLHNVFTDKTVLEKDIKKKHIRLMITENMQDAEILKVRKAHSEERRKAHKAMMEHHSAKSIQSLYYQWKGRQRIKKQRWILERRKLFQLRARQAAAVLMIQRRFRSSRNK